MSFESSQRKFPHCTCGHWLTYQTHTTPGFFFKENEVFMERKPRGKDRYPNTGPDSFVCCIYAQEVKGNKSCRNCLPSLEYSSCSLPCRNCLPFPINNSRISDLFHQEQHVPHYGVNASLICPCSHLKGVPQMNSILPASSGRGSKFSVNPSKDNRVHSHCFMLRPLPSPKYLNWGRLK